MTALRSRKGLRGLWLMLVAAFIVTSAVPVLAANDLYSQEYWNETAQKVAGQYNSDRELEKNFEQFVKSLSSAAGNQQVDTGTTDGGKVYAIVIGFNSKYYAGGAVLGEKKTIDTNTTKAVGSGSEAGFYTKIEGLADGYGTQYNDKIASGSGGNTIDVYVFKELSTRETSKISSSISTGVLKNANVTPDTGTATQLAGGLVPIINTFLGILVIAISIGMTVFTTLDCVYLAFPVFQQTVDSAVEGGGKGTHTRKDGSTSSRFVTDEARTALKDGREQGKSPWLLYLSKRAAAFIFLAVVLFILVTGNIFALMTMVTDVLEGLFSVLFS